ncbi:hypothetical protein G7054_g11468 [Neopestalotiopsis clavispora]|nr:hypothetical protein G7054_g11468 [Neopestalotiopsis clavispora]
MDCRQVPPPEERVVYATAEPWGPRLHSQEHPGSLAQYSDMQPFDELSRPMPPPYAHQVYERVLVRDPRGDEYYTERPLSMKSPLISQEDTEPEIP